MTFTISEGIIALWPYAAGVAWCVIAVLVARWLFRSWFILLRQDDYEMAVFGSIIGGVFWPLLAAFAGICFFANVIVVWGNNKK
jgi:hypothetical protein